MSGVDWREQMEYADDLDAVQAALIREQMIRKVMAETGEDRQTVTDMADAMQSMADEAVLDLTEGQPTTLRDAVQRYADELEGRDELQPRDRITEELAMILGYPWSKSAELEIERPDDESVTIKVGGELVADANHDDHGWAGMDMAITVARNVHQAVMDRVVR
jgi:hypothetical protein